MSETIAIILRFREEDTGRFESAFQNGGLSVMGGIQIAEKIHLRIFDFCYGWQ